MKCVRIVGLGIAFLGSLFAAYDNFPYFNKLNTSYFSICKKWDIIVSKIEPYTVNSRVPIEKMAPFYTVERRNEEFGTLLVVIKLNSALDVQNVDKIIVSVAQIDSWTRLGGSVILATKNYQYFIASPDILVQWVKDFRRTWFLKWGLILMAIGTAMRIIEEICHKVPGQASPK